MRQLKKRINGSSSRNKRRNTGGVLLFLMLLIGPAAVIAQGQPTIRIYGPNYYGVTSYDGLIHNQVHRIHIQMQGQGVHYRNWSIRAMITRPMNSEPPNVSGRTFPEDKLKLRFIDERITGGPPNPHPTLQNLQLPLIGRPLQPAGIETPIVANAIIPLATGSSHYVSIDYNFKIDIEGGRYLADMLSDIGGADWNTSPAIYRTGILFVLYNEHQQEISRSEYPITLQINRPLSNPPPDEGEGFHLEIIGGAREGTLAFTSPANYFGGNSVTYQNGVKVTAGTGYQIQVKSMQGTFLNQQGQGLPLDVLNVVVERSQGAPVDANPLPVRLSTAPQTIVSSSTGRPQAHFYDLQYTTDANDTRLTGISPGRYSTVLLYELTPR